MLVGVATMWLPVKALAYFNPGTTVFSETGPFRLVVNGDRTSAPNGTGDNWHISQIGVDWSFDPDTTVERAYLGFSSDNGDNSVRPQTAPLAISFNGAPAGSYPSTVRQAEVPARPGRFQLAPPPRNMWHQYIDATELISQRGPGTYRIANADNQVDPNRRQNWITTYVIVVLRNEKWPPTQLAINDFFYGQDDDLFADASILVDLPEFPAGGWQYAPGFPRTTILGASFDFRDESHATFVMGDSSGPMPNTNISTPNSFWPNSSNGTGAGGGGGVFDSFNFGSVTIPDPDPSARRFSLNVYTAQSKNGEDNAAWLIFDGGTLIETTNPGLPVIIDNCYSDED
jgi:hypothetical protein